MWSNRYGTAVVIGLLLASGVLAAPDDGLATVEGKVTVDGKPLVEGRLFIHLENDQFVGARIKDGEYKVQRVPPGKWKITLEFTNAPARYADPKKGQLVGEFQKGKNAFDFDLKSK